MPRHPMIRFYEETKAEHPGSIVVMLWGDFYEALGEDDVEVLVEELQLTGTMRDCGDGTSTPMAGFPKHTLDRYVKQLTDAGHKVLVMEQTEALTEDEVRALVAKGKAHVPDGRDLPLLDVDDPEGVEAFIGAHRKVNKRAAQDRGGRQED